MTDESPPPCSEEEDDADGARHVQLEFAGEITMIETVLAEEVGDGLWYLHETPLTASEVARFADVIQVEETEEEGRLRFVRVVEASTFRTWDWVLSARTILSPEFEALKARIMAEGGNWEHAMGGVFIAHLPPESAFDPEPEVWRIHAAITPRLDRPTDRLRAESAPPARRPWWRFWR